eukprot:12988-Lingulodinium_polyedra.AAC.1
MELVFTVRPALGQGVVFDGDRAPFGGRGQQCPLRATGPDVEFVAPRPRRGRRCGAFVRAYA